MDNKDIINGKYLPVLEYLNETKGNYFPTFTQSVIAKKTNTSIRSTRDYLAGKKFNWMWLFSYANILNVNVKITVEDMFVCRKYRHEKRRKPTNCSL